MSDSRTQLTDTMPTLEDLGDVDISGRAGSLSTAEKLTALKQVQAQAEQRIKLGTQLLKAAEAHTSQSQSVIDKVRSEQNHLRDKLEQDVTKALNHYDEWIGTVEESLTGRMDRVERRLESLSQQWEESEQRLTRMIKRAEALFDQSRSMLESVKAAVSRKKAIRPAMNTAQAPTQMELEKEEPTMLYGKLMGKLYERGSDSNSKSSG